LPFRFAADLAPHEWAQIEAEYDAGKMAIRKLAAKNNLSRSVLARHLSDCDKPNNPVGRPPALPSSVEAQLAASAREAHASGFGYTQQDMRVAARCVATALQLTDFKASSSWLRLWKLRHGFRVMQGMRTTGHCVSAKPK
jgi:hypothetical protein